VRSLLGLKRPSRLILHWKSEMWWPLYYP